MSNTQTINKPDDSNRRSFLKKFWLGLGIIAGIETLYLISNFFSHKTKPAEGYKDNFVKLGEARNYKRSSITPFRNHKFFLSRSKNGGFLALSIKCSHLGCNVIWKESQKRFICPCHSSWFNAEGNVMQPPATRPLPVHPIIIEKGIVMVNTSIIQKRNSIDDTTFVYANKKA